MRQIISFFSTLTEREVMNKESRKLMMNGQGNLDYNSKPTETKIPKAATIIPDAFSTPRNS